MLERCYKDGEFKQAIGIGLEAYRLDVLKTAVDMGNRKELLAYILECSLGIVQNLGFRNQVICNMFERW